MDRAWYPDCWDLPGGHLEPGEAALAALAALKRECREELGINVLHAVPVPARCDDAAVAQTVMKVERWCGEPTNKAIEEHDAIAWVTSGGLVELRYADPGHLSLLSDALAGSALEHRGR